MKGIPDSKIFQMLKTIIKQFVYCVNCAPVVKYFNHLDERPENLKCMSFKIRKTP